MQPVLHFLEAWVPYSAFTVASFFIILWLFSIVSGPEDKRVVASLLWSFFWPLIWLYYRFTGKDSFHPARGVAISSTKGTTELGVAGGGIKFKTVREAKDFLAGQIAEEAKRDGTPLTEVERKMLYFTETGWTLPDMKQVSVQFDREYDQNDYERKIGELASRIQSRARASGQLEERTWDSAIQSLSDGDHYLLVLVDGGTSARKGTRHNLKVLMVALALYAFVALEHWFRQWMRDH